MMLCKMRLTTCSRCGTPYEAPNRQRSNRVPFYCPRCQPPTHQDPEYRRNRALILRGSPLCRWCGLRSATVADHVLPIAAGGTHALDNLVPACAPCNDDRNASFTREHVTGERDGEARYLPPKSPLRLT